MAAVVECKAGVAPDAVAAIEETMAVLEEPRWMVLEDRPSGRAWVAGYFDSRAAATAAWRRLAAALDPAWLASRDLPGPVKPELRELPEADWRDSYKAHFKAWRYGRLHWVPAWERGTYRLPPGDKAVWLDPGMAFGTGNHETTRLCCERLVAFATQFGVLGSGLGVESSGNSKLKTQAPGLTHRFHTHCERTRQSVKWSRDAPVADFAPHATRASRPQCEISGLSVIDAGCGSGILAISAARLGLGPVVGFDNDPEAIRVSRENAVLNDVEDRVEFFTGELPSGLAGRQAGLVLANIQADVLRILRPPWWVPLRRAAGWC
ncbi:MAG: 50S ribosomal protein L11 methyltransferase [Opitutaceae bacterium]|nr:50S ribosomal protein L11 methyltransferase [Opitutaceae bacterium]